MIRLGSYSEVRVSLAPPDMAVLRRVVGSEDGLDCITVKESDGPPYTVQSVDGTLQVTYFDGYAGKWKDVRVYRVLDDGKTVTIKCFDFSIKVEVRE